MNNGKRLTILILLIATLAAALGWWHNMNKGRAALAFWGGRVAHRIRTAAAVELWVFATDDGFVARQEAFGNRVFRIARVIDISQAPGLVHARQALISDPSFDWEASVSGAAGGADTAKTSWQYAMRFSSEGESNFVLLDLEHAWAAEGEHPGRSAKLTIGDGLRKFLKEQLDAAQVANPKM